MTRHRIEANDFASFALSAEHVAEVAIVREPAKDPAKTVHNWAGLGHVTFRPKTEEVRQPRFSLASVIEVAVISELSRAGYGVKQSVAVARLAVDRAKQLATLPDAEEPNQSQLDTLGFSYEDHVLVFSFRPDGSIDHNYYSKSHAIGDLFPKVGPVYSPFNKHVFQMDYLLFRICERYSRMMTERSDDPEYFDLLANPPKRPRRKK